jgi:hypothetical protein
VVQWFFHFRTLQKKNVVRTKVRHNRYINIPKPTKEENKLQERSNSIHQGELFMNKIT